MSVARGFGLNGKSIYTNVAKPVLVNLNFTVTPTNGLGITSLKSNGFVENNPNPANGFGVIQLKQNFNYFLGLLNYSITPPNVTPTKIDNSALTIGQAYVISTLGNATAAQWTTVGVPAGVTPAVGVAFIAIATTATTANTSTSRVSLPGVSAVTGIETIGVTNTSITSAIASNAGQRVYFQFTAPTISTGAYVSPYIPTAPTAGSIVSLGLFFDGSSVTIDGL